MQSDRPVEHWKGAFGDAYISRNVADAAAVRQRTLVWGRYLWPVMAELPNSILEVGCSIGINLRALKNLVGAELFAVEPNQSARDRVLAEGVLDADHLFDATADRLPLADGAVEMSFTTGVLIHVPPAELPAAMDELHRVSSRYVLMSEYFADQPEEKTYRGETGLLFKRDFGAMMLERHRDLKLVDYGFLWKHAGASDSGNWWLFEKRG